MSWEHNFDRVLWKGERTHDDGNLSEYEPQKIKDFLLDYIKSFGEKPSAADIMAELDIRDEFYTDVECELNIFDYEEEVEFRDERITESV